MKLFQATLVSLLFSSFLLACGLQEKDTVKDHIKIASKTGSAFGLDLNVYCSVMLNKDMRADFGSSVAHFETPYLLQSENVAIIPSDSGFDSLKFRDEDIESSTCNSLETDLLPRYRQVILKEISIYRDKDFRDELCSFQAGEEFPSGRYTAEQIGGRPASISHKGIKDRCQGESSGYSSSTFLYATVQLRKK